MAGQQEGEMSLRDKLGSAAHDAWMQENTRNGITTRLSSLTGEEQMVPFSALSDEVKAYDYALVDVILNFLDSGGYHIFHDHQEITGETTR